MKLNWFSPLPPARTDVAHYTSRILSVLCAHADITLWTDQPHWDAALEEHARVRQYRSARMPWAEINRADLTFYNIGNNPLFHSTIWQVSRRHAGTVILHDFRLHHFFDGVYRKHLKDTDEYLMQMMTFYGEKGLRDATEFIANEEAYIDYMAERYPLTPLALENALAALVHTRDAFDHLKKFNRWLVAYAPLPFGVPPRTNHIPTRKVATAHSRAGHCRLVVFGYINRNRRLVPLFEALARLPGKDRFRLDIYGEIWDPDFIREQIRSRGLASIVTLHGFVPEAELEKALIAADLAINLRYPTMGEASGTQLRIWSHALPSLVTQVGWYASLPDTAVAHVRPAHEITDIQTHLRAYLEDPARFTEMGAKGQLLLEEQHAPETYVCSILDVAIDAQQFRPRATAYSLAERVAVEMGAWTKSTALDEMRRVSETIYELTNTRGECSKKGIE